MKQITSQEVSVGTLVLKTGINKGYGIVVERNFWLTGAIREDRQKHDSFLESEKELDLSQMIPIMWLEKVKSERMVQKNRDLTWKEYLERFTYSNVSGDVTIIPTIEGLQSTLWQMLLFFGGNSFGAEYVENVMHGLRALEIYLKGGYDLESPALSHYYREMIMLYEMGLPKRNN